MIKFLVDPWPWFFAGPMIALVMFVLIWSGKTFGMSSNLRTICSVMGANKRIPYFQFDWKKQYWNLTVAFGALIGGFIASEYMSPSDSVQISQQTIANLNQLGIADAGKAYLPSHIYGPNMVSNFGSIFILLLGGFFVGFGARYAGGCTSGHAISGLSNLQFPSLIAVVGFFIGGLIMNYFILPILL